MFFIWKSMFLTSMFYCMFYFTCDRSLIHSGKSEAAAGPACQVCSHKSRRESGFACPAALHVVEERANAWSLPTISLMIYRRNRWKLGCHYSPPANNSAFRQIGAPVPAHGAKQTLIYRLLRWLVIDRTSLFTDKDWDSFVYSRHRSQSHKWKRLTGQQYDWLATWSRLGVAKWLAAAWVKYDWRRRLSRIKCVL